MTSRAPRHGIAVLALWAAWLCAPSLLHAQAVQVTARTVDAATGTAVAGATVYLLRDEATVAIRLSNDGGYVRFEAPSPGRYELRVERIGFESSVFPPLDVPESGLPNLTLSLNARPIQLAELSVTGERLCEGSGADASLQQVWGEAQKALVATLASTVGSEVQSTLVVESRALDRDGEVLAHAADTITTRRSQAFPFIPVDSLELNGWGSMPAEGLSWLYGPSPNALLSEWFVRTHCLSFTSGGDEALLGLEFESVEDAMPIGMRGVFWIDRDTSMLRRIVFAYVLPNRRANSDEWDGEVVFGVDEAGRWFAQRWRIRRPQRGSWGRVFEEMINRPLGQMPREGLFGGFYERSGRVLQRTRTPTG